MLKAAFHPKTLAFLALALVVGLASQSRAQDPVPTDFTIAYTRLPADLVLRAPHYRVDVRADGLVTYTGLNGVLVRGRIMTHTDPQTLSDLTALLDEAMFDTLAASYSAPTANTGDNASLTVTRDGLTKTVAHRGSPVPGMPAALSAIEDRLDQIADTAAFIDGNERTLTKLRAAGWDFRSQAGGELLIGAVERASPELIDALLAEHPPLDVTRATSGSSEDAQSLFEAATTRGDVALLDRLLAAGLTAPAAPGLSQALAGPIGQLNAPMVEELLKLGADANASVGGQRPLALVVQQFVAPATPQAASQLAVVRALLAAGADPSAGNLLSQIADPDLALLFIAAGADVTVAGPRGSICDTAAARGWSQVLAALPAGCRTAPQNN